MLRYISSKHSKFGIKFWVLAESATGYIIRMTCNLGKKFQPVTSGFCEGTTVFMDLLRESLLLGRGYHVFATVFFSSIELAKALRNHRTFLTRTIRSNRRLPATIKDANVDSETTHFMKKGDHLLAAHKRSNSRRPDRLFLLRFLPTLLKVCLKLSEHTTAAWVKSMVQICNYLFTATQENH